MAGLPSGQHGRSAPVSGADEDEHSLSDSDHALSDADQTSSDSDRTSASSDQVAADRDQAASDRDLASGADPVAHELSQSIRQGTARQRERAASKREQTAQARHLRDESAGQRDPDARRDGEGSADQSVLEGGDAVMDGQALRLQELRARAGVREAATSQLHLAALVDSSEDAIVSKSLDGLIVSWNHGAQELFGYTPDEAIGASIAILVPPERSDELAEILASVRRGDRVPPLETTRVVKDGRVIDVSLRISVIFNAAGEVTGASSISRDITRQKLAEAELRRSSRYFDLARDLTVVCGFDGYLKSVNPALEHVLGWSAEEFLARPFTDMVHPDDRAATQRVIDELAGGESSSSFVNRFEARDGGYRWLDWKTIVPPDEAVMYASGRDITERVEMEAALREAEQRFRTAFDRAPIGVCLLSLDRRDPGGLQQVNPALAEILGSSVEELTGAPVSSLTDPADHADIYAKLSELTEGRDHVEFETRFMHRDGHPVWALISAAPVTHGDEAGALAVTHVMDISDRKQSERQLQHLADHDALTGLFNRRRFVEELARALRHAKRFGEGGAVLFLDLDGFKSVNDTLGHAAGDELIARVASLLSGSVRETDTLARMGGDEFAILLVRCDEKAAVTVAEKLLAALRHGGLNGNDPSRCSVSSSIGIALYRGDENLSADGLVVGADTAMYDAKQTGKDRYAIFDRTKLRT